MKEKKTLLIRNINVVPPSDDVIRFREVNDLIRVMYGRNINFVGVFFIVIVNNLVNHKIFQKFNFIYE